MSNEVNTPDFTTIVFRKKSSPPPKDSYKGHGISTSVKIEKQADDGNFTVKKYDQSFIQQVINFRTSKGMKQDDFAKKVGISGADLKSFEKNLSPYNPNLVSRLKQFITKN